MLALNRPTFRRDIQGLRALAVGLVVVFHIWPSAVPGGYVGVDVFFVISGYLITGHLLREQRRSGRIDLPAFFARRIRRLLPAATFVVFAVVAFSWLLPAYDRISVAWDAVAGVFYVQNWRLAELSVAYLAEGDPAGPPQHYWSLSVEEQFYLVWPLLILLGATYDRRRGRNVGLGIAAVMTVAVAASLAASVYVTQAEPARAYFVTHTRIWELGAGGLLAFAAPRLAPVIRAVLPIAGLVAVVAAAALFDAATPFPGVAALLPVLGTLCVLAGDDVVRAWHPNRLLGAAPVRYLGDISYSVYLWHWPLIVFWGALDPSEGLSAIEGAALIGATVALSTLSKRLIEDRFRFPRRRSAGSRDRAYALGGSLSAATAIAAMIVPAHSAWEARRPVDLGDYPGAMAVYRNAIVPIVDEPAPTLANVRGDLPDAYRRRCHLGYEGSEPVPCTYGDETADVHIVIVGDSHAAHWIPAFAEAARSQGWLVTAITKSACPLMTVPVTKANEPYADCTAWQERTFAMLRELRPDAVVMAQSSRHRLVGVGPSADRVAAVADGLVATWAEMGASDAELIAVADTPWFDEPPAACLSTDGPCVTPLADAAPKDPIRLAASRSEAVTLLDLTGLVCPAEQCPADIGNVVVWRDQHHLTATYAATLAVPITDAMRPIIGR